MHPVLAIEVQKAIAEERLRNAALAQHQLLVPPRTKLRIATRVRSWSAMRGCAPWHVRAA